MIKLKLTVIINQWLININYITNKVDNMIRLEDKHQLLNNAVIDNLKKTIALEQMHSHADKKIRRLQHDMEQIIFVAIVLALCNLLTVLLVVTGFIG